MSKAWNRCDACGKYIPFVDFENGAIRELRTPDTAFTSETYETLCEKCAKKYKPGVLSE